VREEDTARGRERDAEGGREIARESVGETARERDSKREIGVQGLEEVTEIRRV